MSPSRHDISERAYARWVENGRPDGTEVKDWLEAEGEFGLLAEHARGLAEQAAPGRGRLLHAVLENSPAVVYVKDVRGRYVLVNRRFEDLFGVTRREVIGRTDHDLFPAAVADALRANDRLVLAAGAPLEFEEAVPHGGRTRAYISLKFPVTGPDGTPYAVCGISTDITARKRAERRLAAEHAVTRALARSAALGDAAPRVLRAACESLGWDVGLFWAVDRPAAVLRCLEVCNLGADGPTAFERLSRSTTLSRGAGLPGRVWAAGQPAWVADAAGDVGLPRAAAALEEGLHSACGFPVRNGGETLGVLEFFGRAARAPDADELAMMASVGSQVSQFIERRQAERALHERERELSLARAIQQRRIPRAPPAAAGFEIGGASEPTQETGGDYLDYFPVPGGAVGVALGDASGHGIGAALLMAETRAYLRALAGPCGDVGAALSRVNRHVSEDGDGDDFVTLFLGRLDPRTRRLEYASAGHWPGYLLGAAGEVKAVLGSTGLPLGVDPAASIPAAAPVTLEPGDLLLLLSDGVAEAFGSSGPMFGMPRVLDCVRAHRLAAPGEIVAALFEEVRAFSEGKPVDDVTAAVIKALPA